MGVVVDGTEYDIALTRSSGSTMGFMIQKHSDRRERVDDFAPSLSTTGDLAYSTGIWRPWTQDTWVGGLGQERWSTSEQDNFYEANDVETRISGKVMMQTHATVGDSGWAAEQPVDFAAQIWMRASSTNVVRKYDGSSWSSHTGLYGTRPTDLAVFGTHIYVASANSHYVIFTAGGSAHDGGVDREKFCTFNPGATPTLYGSHGHQIFATTDGSTWGTAIDIGDSSADITSMAPFDGYLYIGKEDGLYYYDGSSVVQALSCKNRLWSSNFVEMAEWEGYLYFNILRQVYKYSSTAIVDITPQMYGSLTKEAYDYGTPKAFVSSPTALYVGFDLAENDYPCVLAYTGQGWHPVYKGDSGDAFYGLGYSAEYDWLLFNDGDTRYRELTSMSDYPSPSFSTAATGALVFPRFDGGMPMTPKAVKNVILHTRDCSDTEKITIQYKQAGESSWTEVGSVTQSPKQEIAVAATAGALKVESDIQFRLLFQTGSATVSPTLEHFTLNWLPRPAAIFAYVATLRLGDPLAL